METRANYVLIGAFTIAVIDFSTSVSSVQPPEAADTLHAALYGSEG